MPHMTKEAEPPWAFGDEDFTVMCKDRFNAYVELRIRGFHSEIALARAFGPENAAAMDNTVSQRIFYLESNEYYIDRFDKRLKEISVDDLWNTRLAVHEMLSILRSPYTKDGIQLSAAKELNVIYGITVTDESGRTRAGRSLVDFYKDVGQPNQIIDDTGSNNQ